MTGDYVTQVINDLEKKYKNGIPQTKKETITMIAKIASMTITSNSEEKDTIANWLKKTFITEGDKRNSNVNESDINSIFSYIKDYHNACLKRAFKKYFGYVPQELLVQ